MCCFGCGFGDDWDGLVYFMSVGRCVGAHIGMVGKHTPPLGCFEWTCGYCKDVGGEQSRCECQR